MLAILRSHVAALGRVMIVLSLTYASLRKKVSICIFVYLEVLTVCSVNLMLNTNMVLFVAVPVSGRI